MIKTLILQNFRGFEHHSIEFSKRCLVVGRNNAGKSTIIEALRLISLAVARYKTVKYVQPPEHFFLPDGTLGIQPSARELEFNFENICYHYRDPPSIVEAIFNDGASIKVYVDKEKTYFAQIRDSSRQQINVQNQSRRVSIPPLQILPQVAPIAIEERVLNEDYIRRSATSHLASQHFRNQLNLWRNQLEEFTKLAESTWPKLRIMELTTVRREKEMLLSLLIRDGDFVAEAAWMGHGLQIWLQTMWFLSRLGKNEIAILDEPDVYLHADLQRRLIRFVKDHGGQVLIATHSVEMIAEVTPDEIVIIDRNRSKSSGATSLPAVQKIVESVGSMQNVHLIHLWSAKKLLLVEGKDIKLLKTVQNLLFPSSLEPIDTIPSMELGGWGGWRYAIGSTMLMKNAGGVGLHVYCIFDSDFHTDTEISERRAEAVKHGIHLHIWKKKEIENYFIHPALIQRIMRSSDVRKPLPSTKNIEEFIGQACDTLKNEVFDSYAEEYARLSRKGISEANRTVRKVLDGRWKDLESKISIVPGKALLSQISKWAQDNYGISIGINSLLKNIRKEDIPDEMIRVIGAIEQVKPFDSL